MLKKITLEDYRCFEKTEISFREHSVIVGKNNAGKSTLIEALRILALVVNRCINSHYIEPPTWLKLPVFILGIKPSLNNIDISPSGIIFMYREGPAKIIADFEDGTQIIIYINFEAEIFATIFDSKGMNVESRRFAASVKLSV